MSNPELPQTERLEAIGPDGITIKQLVLEDADPYFRLIDEDRTHLGQEFSGKKDPTASKYQSVEDVRESILNPRSPSHRFRFGIWDGSTMVGSNSFELGEDGRAKLGSWIGKSHTGQNYAARGRKPLVQLAFKTFSITEVYSEILVGNEASRKSLEKSRFIYDGTIGDRWIFKLHREDFENTRTEIIA